jgi:hypothetical protein
MRVAVILDHSHIGANTCSINYNGIFSTISMFPLPKTKIWVAGAFLCSLFSRFNSNFDNNILNLLIRTKHKNLFEDIICSFMSSSTSFNGVHVNLGNNYLKEANRLFFDKDLSTRQ